jgi:hypothetical protein
MLRAILHFFLNLPSSDFTFEPSDILQDTMHTTCSLSFSATLLLDSTIQRHASAILRLFEISCV